MNIVYKVKSKIVPLMPIFLYQYWQKRKNIRPTSFIGGYINYKGKIISDNNTNESNYKSVIDILGFGYSGSGAVLDLLSECDNCFCIGHSDKNSFDNVHYTLGYEADFVRLSGGIFEIERYIGSNNYFHNDALLNRFIKCSENFPPFIENSKVRQCFYEFFDKIVEFKMLNIKGNPYNNYLYPGNSSSNILFLKLLSHDEYRIIAKNFLQKLFTILNTQKADILVFDHILGDGELDIDRKVSYIPQYKPIFVYRDPRDVFTFAIDQNITWIAHDTVDDFIKWFSIMTREFKFLDLKNVLIVQFEKLVAEYDSEEKRILEFVGIDSSFHNQSKKFHFFNPVYSKRNVGIWQKNNVIPKSDFDKIYDCFSQFCYLGKN